MKKKRNTTDNGRTIISKTGKEQPKSAKGNWTLWLIVKDKHPDELQAMFTNYKQKIKSKEIEIDKTTDKEKLNQLYSEIRGLRRDLLIINDTLRINKRKIKEERRIKDEPLQMEFFGNNSRIEWIGSDGSYENLHIALLENESGCKLIQYSTKGGQSTYDGTMKPIDAMSYTVLGEYEISGSEIIPYDRNKSYLEWAYHKNISPSGEIIISESNETYNWQDKEIEEFYRKQKEQEEKAKEEERKRKHRESQQKYREKKKNKKE